jgi:peroxiredoxin
MIPRDRGTAPRMYPTKDQILQAGKPAPDFSLKATPTQSVKLSDLMGRPVVLAFYPADFSPVCSDQMALYQAATPAFAQYSAQVIGLSTDGPWCHQAFAQRRGIKFPLLADAWPHGAVAETYGVLDTDEGLAARALFVIDPQGTVTWSYVSPAGINPGANGILAALETMTGKVRLS